MHCTIAEIDQLLRMVQCERRARRGGGLMSGIGGSGRIALAQRVAHAGDIDAAGPPAISHRLEFPIPIRRGQPQFHLDMGIRRRRENRGYAAVCRDRDRGGAGLRRRDGGVRQRQGTEPVARILSKTRRRKTHHRNAQSQIHHQVRPQNTYFKASCIWRMLNRVPVITPNELALLAFTLGSLHAGWFMMLNASQRNCSEWPS